jgi:hypothetical protein
MKRLTSNLLEVVIAPNTNLNGLSVQVHAGIMLDKGNTSLKVGKKWIINHPKHNNNPVVENNRLVGASFFRNENNAYIAAPLPYGMWRDKYIHPQDREVLIDVRGTEIENVVFIRNIFNKGEEIEDQVFLDRKINTQLHDVSQRVNMILMRMRVGQIVRIFTKSNGIVSLGLTQSGRIQFVFGYILSERLIDMMKDGAEHREKCERQARESKDEETSEEEEVTEYLPLKALPLEHAFDTFCVRQPVSENTSGKKIPNVPRRSEAPKLSAVKKA